MRIGVIGINHKLANLGTRELLAKAFQRRFSHAKILHPNQSFILLSTCNRTELYFSSNDLAATHAYILSSLREEISVDFEQKLYSFFQYDCFIHLARVVSGLDSALLFETEIQGQVKEAYQNATCLQPLEKDLHFLFQKCLKIGKEIRTKISPEGQGLEHVCLESGKRFFGSMRPKVLFVGASRINSKIMRFIKEDISITNRTTEKGLKMGVPFVEWDPTLWTNFDWLIFGTKAPDYLITKNNFFPTSRKLIIDLSVPRNVDPGLASPLIHIMNIDEMGKSEGTPLVKTAERSVESLTKIQVALFKKKTLHFPHNQQYKILTVN